LRGSGLVRGGGGGDGWGQQGRARRRWRAPSTPHGSHCCPGRPCSRRAAGSCCSWLRQPQHHACWGGPCAEAPFAGRVGSPGCCRSERAAQQPGESPVAASAPPSLPPSPLPLTPGSPLVASALPPLGGAHRQLLALRQVTKMGGNGYAAAAPARERRLGTHSRSPAVFGRSMRQGWRQLATGHAEQVPTGLWTQVR